MAFNYPLTVSLAGGLSTLSASVDTSVNSRPPFDIDLADNDANIEVSAEFTTAALKGIYILATGDITLKTNSSSAPDNTWTIPGGVPFVWHIEWADWFPCPFTADVTALFLTNGFDGANSVKIDIAVDATP